MRRVTLTAAALALGLGLSALAGDARAAGGPQITIAGPVKFPGRAYILTLPKRTPVTTANVQVTENGAPVDSLFVGLPGAGGTQQAGTVLLLDASNSMRGDPISGAVQAARKFAARRNPGQQLALVTFNDRVGVSLPFTAVPAKITGALSSTPRLREGTRIYDALARGLGLIRESGLAAGSIVLLSDGTDVGSKATKATVLDELRAAHVRVFAVGLRSKQFDRSVLRSLAESTAGSYAEARSAASLTPIFDKLGYKLANEYLITYRSLTGPEKSVDVAVKIAGLPGTARTTYTTPALSSVAATFHRSGWDKVLRSWITAVLVAIAVVALLMLAIRNVARGPDIQLRRRMSQFIHIPSEEEVRRRHAEITELLARRAERSFANRRWWQEFVDDVALADIRTPAATLAVWALLGGLAVGLLVSVILGNPLPIIPGLIVGPLVLRTYVKRELRKKRRAFADQLPDNLEVLASALRAGHSLVGALSVVVADAAEPSKSEFQRVIADEQLGVPLDECLQVTVKRMDNRDLEQVAVVAALQRDTGGNSAEVLDRVAENVRARMEIRRLIRTLTAQGRMARWIVSMLPVFLVVAIILLNRDYISPLWTTTVGVVASIIAAILVLTGSYVIKRIIEIKV